MADFGEKYQLFQVAIRRARRLTTLSITSGKQSPAWPRSSGSRGRNPIRPFGFWTSPFEVDHRSGDVPID